MLAEEVAEFGAKRWGSFLVETLIELQAGKLFELVWVHLLVGFATKTLSSTLE